MYFNFELGSEKLKARLHMRFLMRFCEKKTRLAIPCTNALFAKHRVDWKESYRILFEDTPRSKSC